MGLELSLVKSRAAPVGGGSVRGVLTAAVSSRSCSECCSCAVGSTDGGPQGCAPLSQSIQLGDTQATPSEN